MGKTFSALALVVLMILSFLAVPLKTFAAPRTQTFSAGTYNATDDPRLNSDPSTTATFGGLSIGRGTATGSQTSSDSNQNQIFTWRMQDLSEQICGNAELTSLRIAADVQADDIGTPDLSALMVYRVDGSDTYNIGDYSVINGTDYATSTGGVTPPNNEGIYGVVRGSDPVFGSSLTGNLEATWDLSGYTVNDQFGIMVQQDSQDGTVNLRTSINSVEVAYDDADCVKNSSVSKTLVDPASVKPGGTASYDIVITNNGTDPILVGAGESNLIYDIASPELSFISASGDGGLTCVAQGKLQDALESDPGAALAYQNHLDYNFLVCGSEDGGVTLQPGQSATVRLVFNVSNEATSITNTASFGIGGDQEFPVDPGVQSIMDALSTINSGSDDLFDRIFAGQVQTDNVVVVRHNLSQTDGASLDGAQATDASLAAAGSSVKMYLIASSAMLAISLAVLKKRFSNR